MAVSSTCSIEDSHAPAARPLDQTQPIRMTDTDAIELILAGVDPAGGKLAQVYKNGRLLLVLPDDKQAAMKALRLYQPQRALAKAFVGLLKFGVAAGIHQYLLPGFSRSRSPVSLTPDFPCMASGSAGVMLGSPEHRVRRAIVSYRASTEWEVAKVAFGPGCWDVIHGEASALESLPEDTEAAPHLLGTHRGPDLALIRMPYFQGSVLNPGESSDAIAVLESWISGNPPVAMAELPEWPFIESALALHPATGGMVKQLSKLELTPAVRHGDFARWNLVRLEDNRLMTLDWEWGVARGMPGIDLVHYFAQDARLVDRLPPAEVVRSVGQALRSPECQRYLEKTGWHGNSQLAILASIAFTVGTKQQANEDVLSAAVAACL